MKKIAVLFMVALCLFGCKRNTIHPAELKLKNCHVEYLYFKDGIFLTSDLTLTFIPDTTFSTKCNYEYSGNEMTRSDGGFAIIPTGSDYSNNIFLNDVYDSICHLGNDIYLYQKGRFNGKIVNDYRNPIIFSLDKNGRLIGMSKENPWIGGRYKLSYTYSQDKITEADSTGVTRREFYFKNQNLVRVEDYTYDSQGKIFSKEEILFSGYDDHVNPFRNKYFVKGAFFRAFSQNNYTSFTRNEYDRSTDGTLELSGYYMFSMPIKYDSEGNPEFGDYE